MTALTQQPTNFNLLLNNRFQMSFRRIPNITYYLQSLSLPSLFMGGPILTGPTSDLQLPGDKMQTDAIQITFLVDEDLNGYRELYNWIVGIGFPEDHEQYRELTKAGAEGEETDMEMIILSNNSNPMHKFQFEHVHIQSLGPLDFSTNAGEEPVIGSATFSYQIPFKIESL